MGTATINELEEKALQAAQECRSAEDVKLFTKQFGDPLETGIDSVNTKTLVSFAYESAANAYLKKCKELSGKYQSLKEAHENYKINLTKAFKDKCMPLRQHYGNVLSQIRSGQEEIKEEFLQSTKFARISLQYAGLDPNTINKKLRTDIKNIFEIII
jgi:hypothetical protein